MRTSGSVASYRHQFYLINMTMTSNIERITSLESPALEPYRTLRRPMDHIKRGVFIAEGAKVVERLFDSGLEILSLLLTPEWHDQFRNRLEHDRRPTLRVFIADKAVVEKIVGFNLHQGIMALARVPAQRSLDEVLGAARTPLLVVALDGLVSAENVGVVVRNCVAFGVHALVVGETCSSPYLRRAVRNSMGGVFHLPVIHTPALVESLNDLRIRYQARIVAAHPRGNRAIESADFSGSLCIVFGNEGEGISENVLNQCTDHIAIPMKNSTDSLNVASASAVLLYEASRQHHKE